MTELRAVYYDGRSARGQAVTLRFDAAGRLELLGVAPPLRYALGELKFSERIGSTPRSIGLPNGAKCEVDGADANEAIDALLSAHRAAPWARLVHRLETAWRYIALLFVLAAVVLWAFVNHGVPEIARHVAFAMPVSADRALAQNTLEVLDRGLFAPSGLDAARQNALKAQFDDATRELDPRYRFRLELRKSRLAGANAFALPDGTIVVTDALVELAERDEELLAVLAHEIGHVVHRHGLRSALQSSAVALFIALAIGDVLSVTSFAAALPTLLVEAKFSRDFERESDRYALEFLRTRRIAPQHAAAILKRLVARGGDRPGALEYFSSHPGIDERAAQFGAAR